MEKCPHLLVLQEVEVVHDLVEELTKPEQELQLLQQLLHCEGSRQGWQ